MGSQNKGPFEYFKNPEDLYLEALEYEISTSPVVNSTSFKNKKEFKENINSFDIKIQNQLKRTAKRMSSLDVDIVVTEHDNGLIVLAYKKPGKVPGSYAIYYKIIFKDGTIRSVFKDTYDNHGKFVHRKIKDRKEKK